jgi:hypothetical protein
MSSIKETLNLCGTCKFEFVECDGNFKFGCGVGNDNVYKCDKYQLIAYCL